jgi:plasmid stabilization system protein ParE
MHIRYSKQASNFLENLYKSIYEDKPSVAKIFVNDFQRYIELLQISPYMGKECIHKNIQDDCRVVIYKKNYIIVYKILKDTIFIKTIRNTKTKG